MSKASINITVPAKVKAHLEAIASKDLSTLGIVINLCIRAKYPKAYAEDVPQLVPAKPAKKATK